MAGNNYYYIVIHSGNILSLLSTLGKNNFLARDNSIHSYNMTGCCDY